MRIQVPLQTVFYCIGVTGFSVVKEDIFSQCELNRVSIKSFPVFSESRGWTPIGIELEESLKDLINYIAISFIELKMGVHLQSGIIGQITNPKDFFILSE